MHTTANANQRVDDAGLSGAGAIDLVGDDVYDALGSDSVTTPSSGSDYDEDDKDNEDRDWAAPRSLAAVRSPDLTSDFTRTRARPVRNGTTEAAAAANSRAYDDVEDAVRSESDEDFNGEPPVVKDYNPVVRQQLPTLRMLSNKPPFGSSCDPTMSPKFQSNLQDLLGGGGISRFSAASELRADEAEEAREEEENLRTTMDPRLIHNHRMQQQQKQQQQQQQQDYQQERTQAHSKSAVPKQHRRAARRREPGVRTILHAGDLAGNRGEQDVDSLLSFINGGGREAAGTAETVSETDTAKAQQQQPAKKKSAKEKHSAASTIGHAEKENSHASNGQNEPGPIKKPAPPSPPSAQALEVEPPPPAPPQQQSEQASESQQKLPPEILSDLGSLAKDLEAVAAAAVADPEIDLQPPVEPDFEVVLSKKDRRQKKQRPEQQLQQQQQQQRPFRKPPLQQQQQRHRPQHSRQALSHVVNGNNVQLANGHSSSSQSRSESPGESRQQQQMYNPAQYAALLQQKAKENALLRRDLDSCSHSHSRLISFLYSLC